MTKLKECDSCGLKKKTVEKYRSRFDGFEQPKKFGTGPDTVSRYRAMQFYLCPECFDFLVPEDKHLPSNRVEHDFVKDILFPKLHKERAYKPGNTMYYTSTKYGKNW